MAPEEVVFALIIAKMTGLALGSAVDTNWVIFNNLVLESVRTVNRNDNLLTKKDSLN